VGTKLLSTAKLASKVPSAAISTVPIKVGSENNHTSARVPGMNPAPANTIGASLVNARFSEFPFDAESVTVKDHPSPTTERVSSALDNETVSGVPALNATL
jgi:hypothetical protein